MPCVDLQFLKIYEDRDEIFVLVEISKIVKFFSCSQKKNKKFYSYKVLHHSQKIFFILCTKKYYTIEFNSKYKFSEIFQIKEI